MMIAVLRLTPSGLALWLAHVVGLLAGPAMSAAEPPGPLSLVSVRKIWDQAPHSAFGDMIRYRGSWFVAFREGEFHASYHGSFRVIRSVDGERWESAAQIISATSDLRDPHFSITPDGQL